MDPILNSGDTASMLISTALVILMTIPGLALLYGGLIQARKCFKYKYFFSFVSFSIVSILWFVYGYSVVFGIDVWGFIGVLSNPLFLQIY